MRFAEEILLLLVNEQHGGIDTNYPSHLLDHVFAGAVLMDLALENRIDTDLDHLILVNPEPLGDSLLDPVLSDIAGGAANKSSEFWLERTARRGAEIREDAINRLLKRGILESGPDELVFVSQHVSRTRRYPSGTGKEKMEDVRLRIMRVLFSEDIPDPRDTMLICLADACGIIKRLLSAEEQDEVADRLELVRKMELIGQSLTQAIRQFEFPVAPPPPTKEIPRASTWEFIAAAGDLLRGDLGAFLLKQYRNLGPVFRIQLFTRRYIVLAGADANRFIARNNVHFRSREAWQSFNDSVGARVISSLDGPELIRLRRAFTKGYSLRLIENRLDEAVRITRQELGRWPQNKPVPGRYFCQRLITEQLGLLATNVSALEHIDDIIIYFETLLERHLMKRRPTLAMYSPKFRRARRSMEKFGRRIMDEHRPEKRRGHPPDFIDELLELHRNDPYFYSETDLIFGVLGPFVAALDTLVNILSFVLYELCKQPGLLARVTAEADDLFARGIPDITDLRRLDVTHRVALETLRLHNIALVTPRTVSNSFEFAGYRVPAGAELLVAFALVHLMPEYYPAPERFDIDRYTKDRAEHKQQKGIYAPWGVGAHQCLGSSLAETLLALNVATIVHDTTPVLHPPGYKLKVKHLPVAHPAASFRFKLAGREKQSRQ